MIDPNGLLMIEPQSVPSREPLIDDLTRKVTAALRKAEGDGRYYKGHHICICGAGSGNQDLYTEAGLLTNSLAVHYVAHHRGQIPKEELVKISQLPEEYAEPNEWELATPRPDDAEELEARIEEALRRIKRRKEEQEVLYRWLKPRFFDPARVDTGADRPVIPWNDYPKKSKA